MEVSMKKTLLLIISLLATTQTKPILTEPIGQYFTNVRQLNELFQSLIPDIYTALCEKIKQEQDGDIYTEQKENARRVANIAPYFTPEYAEACQGAYKRFGRNVCKEIESYRITPLATKAVNLVDRHPKATALLLCSTCVGGIGSIAYKLKNRKKPTVDPDHKVNPDPSHDIRKKAVLIKNKKLGAV